MMSLMVSLRVVLFLDENWDLIGSVSEGFPTYFLSILLKIFVFPDSIRAIIDLNTY